MIHLQLFLTFFEIGAVSFGGGYGMISLIREKVLLHGWLTEPEFLNFIAVSESTPGPLAVNMATFIGSSKAGLSGAACATLGVVLPSFVILLLIAALIRNFLSYSGVQFFLRGVRPCVIAMILATACTMALRTLLQFTAPTNPLQPDVRAISLFCILILIHLLWRKWKKTKPSPILMILISAGLGILFSL